jgi:hypothetical protein
MGAGGMLANARRTSSMTPGLGGVSGAKRYVDTKRSAVILEADETLTLAASSVKRKKTDEELRAEEEERLAKRKQKETQMREDKERRKKEREQAKEQRKVERELKAAEERRKSVEIKLAAKDRATSDAAAEAERVCSGAADTRCGCGYDGLGIKRSADWMHRSTGRTTNPRQARRPRIWALGPRRLGTGAGASGGGRG